MLTLEKETVPNYDARLPSLSPILYYPPPLSLLPPCLCERMICIASNFLIKKITTRNLEINISAEIILNKLLRQFLSFNENNTPCNNKRDCFCFHQCFDEY